VAAAAGHESGPKTAMVRILLRPKAVFVEDSTANTPLTKNFEVK
jgi:hypothetical protein